MSVPKQSAQSGLKFIENAIIELLRRNPDGLKSAEIAENLGLRSDFKNNQKDYLTFSVLGGLLKEGIVTHNASTKLFKVL